MVRNPPLIKTDTQRTLGRRTIALITPEAASEIKVWEDIWPEVKTRIQAVYQAPIRAIALDLAKLMFGAMIRVGELWRAIRFTDFERRQMAVVSKDLDAEYKVADTTSSASQRAHRATEISSSFRT
jgi:hypothetical protein